MKKIISSILVFGSVLYATNFNAGMKMLNAGAEQEAKEAFCLAAKSGDLDAQMILGEMYLDGIGVEVDHQKAFFWLSKAAKGGDVEAQYLLGFMYENGLKVAVNIKRATKWYTEAALQGDVLSQYNLAIIYKEGKGEVEKDMKKAFKWLAMVQVARENVDYLASK
jgi:TPR repeat protein